MPTLTFISDLHLGAIRTGGTTPATAYQLRLDLLSQFEDLLYTIKTDLCIGGDLFDGPDISKMDLLQAYRILDDWLVRTGRSLYCLNGNHDLSKTSTNFSSFQFLMALLSAEGQYAGAVHHITQGTMTPHGYMIPHVTNQDLFDLELAKVPECARLFVHCNYNNGFAVESDHSLGMSVEQAQALPVSCVIFAHEHAGRTELGGKVLIVGNQFPSSVSDCLSGAKYMLVINDEGNGDSYEAIPTWSPEVDYTEIDWREAIGYAGPERFIRVTGNATADEASEVVNVISRFRANADALVISNAVQIEGFDDAAQIALSHEQITAFSVRDALREMLTDEENQKIDSLPRRQNA